jgi:L,D-transpeptidase catalytic domain
MPEIDRLHIDITRQELLAFVGSRQVLRFPVSTAARGIGSGMGTLQTPVGEHRVRVKVGDGCPLGAVFHARRWTGEVIDQTLRERFPTRDWVLTRVLWLQGLEPKLNRGGDVDTFRRFIYIHGTHEEELVGQPVSFGCVRMRNADIADLYARVPTGCRLRIE